jgi:hypothetical protein
MKMEFVRNFLNSFFHLFEANLKIVNISKDKVTGSVFWEDEDERQEFLWVIPQNNFNYQDVIELINFIVQNKLIEEDMINISRDTLISELKKAGWGLQKINSSLDFLCSIRVSMIDNGEITDHFLIHF